jgi:hypothetical protein
LFHASIQPSIHPNIELRGVLPLKYKHTSRFRLQKCK